MDQSQFSTTIRARRAELGLTLKEAARHTGIQPSRLHDLEQGRNSTTGKPTAPTRENIQRLAHGYKLSETYLLTLTGFPIVAPETADEAKLISHFRSLTPGHRSAVLTLVDSLYRIDNTN